MAGPSGEYHPRKVIPLKGIENRIRLLIRFQHHARTGCLRMKTVYLIAALAGTLLPWTFFAGFLVEHGVDLSLFVAQLFANSPATGFTVDLLISCAVFWIWSFRDAREHGVKGWWLATRRREGTFACLDHSTICSLHVCNSILDKKLRQSKEGTDRPDPARSFVLRRGARRETMRIDSSPAPKPPDEGWKNDLGAVGRLTCARFGTGGNRAVPNGLVRGNFGRFWGELSRSRLGRGGRRLDLPGPQCTTEPRSHQRTKASRGGE